MRTRLLLVAGLLLTVTLGWFLSGSGRDAKVGIARPKAAAAPAAERPDAELETAVPPPPLPSPPDERIVVRDQKRTTASQAARTKVEEAPADAVRIPVLRGEDREPLAGALVYFLDERSFVEGDLIELEAGEATVDQILESKGRRFRSDAEGLVALPRAHGFGFLAGSQDSLWGMVQYAMGEEDEVELLLFHDPDLVVRVVDTAGIPQGDVTIVFRVRQDEDDEAEDLFGQKTEPGTGETRIVHAFRFLEEFGEEGIPYVAAKIVAHDVIEKEISRDPFPADPIELVLPRCGGVEVRIRHPDGDAFEDAAVVEMVALPFDETSAEEVHFFEDVLPARATARDGRATFAHVGLGTWLGLRIEPVAGYAPLLLSHPGPTKDGERIVIDAYLEGARPVLVGRILDAEGEKLPSQRIEARVSGTAPDGWKGTEQKSLRTDAEGGFRLALPESMPPDASFSLEFSHEADGGQRASALVASQGALRGGENDFGDIRLELSPLLVGGRVIDERGDPVGGATLQLVVSVEYGGGTYWDYRWDHRTFTDGDGRFSLRGHIEGDRIGLAASHPGFVPAEPATVPRGSETVELELVRAGSIRGRLLVDAGIPPRAFSVFATGLADDPSEHHAGPERDGEFVIEGLAAGTYELTALLREEPDCARETRTIVVDTVSRVDPEPVELDFVGRLRTFALRCQDAEGLPLSGEIFTLDPEGDARTSRPFQNGTARITTCRKSLDLEIRVPGFRLERVEGMAEDREVVMRRGILARFEVRGLPDGEDQLLYQLLVQPLEGKGGEAPQFFVLDADGRGETYFQAPGRYQAFVRVIVKKPGVTSTIRVSPRAELEFDIPDSDAPVDIAVPVGAEMIETIEGELDAD